MATSLSYRNPNTGRMTPLSATLTPSLSMRFNGSRGFADLEEPVLTLTGTKTTAAGSSSTLKIAQGALPEYFNCIYGGEFVPNGFLMGKETFLDADIAIDATSMTVKVSTTKRRGIEENIFVAGRPVLLMNRKPLPGENIFETGTKDGLICPAAEIIYIGAAYESGTTIPIVRGTLAAARKKMAVLQAIPGIWASQDEDSVNTGLLYEMERPDSLTLGEAVSTVTDELTVRFIASTQQADTANSNGAYGVVSHYGVWVLPATGLYEFSVRSLPECAAPSEYDDTGQTEAVVKVGSSAIVEEEVSGTTYQTISGLNRAWNPLTGALEAVVGGSEYWVGVKAMNQGTFDADLRASDITFTKVTALS